MRHLLHSYKKIAIIATAVASAGLAAQPQTIPLVSIQGTTGSAAFAGLPYQNAVRLAVDEANAKGGINGSKIELTTRDSANDKGQAINLANQAIDRDRALLVLGPTVTADSVAVAPIFNDKKAPNLSFSASDAMLKFGPWSLKFQQAPSISTQQQLQYVLENTQIRKIAFVYDRTSEGLIDFKNRFRDGFTRGGGSVIAEEAIVGSDANFLPLATKLKSLDLDAVYLAVYGEQAGNMIAQMRQAGISDKVRYIGSIAMVSPKFLSIAGKAAEGSIASADYVPGIDRPLNKSFEAAYKARFGTEPDNWAAVGYSGALVALAALQEAGPTPTREKVREAFQRLRDVPVVIGNGMWNHKDRYPNYGSIVLVVKDGKFVAAP